MLTAADLPVPRFQNNVIPFEPYRLTRHERLNRAGRREYRDAVDAWFSLWTIPAQAYLYWLRELHSHARPT